MNCRDTMELLDYLLAEAMKEVEPIFEKGGLQGELAFNLAALQGLLVQMKKKTERVHDGHSIT